MSDAMHSAQTNMIKQQLRAGNVLDEGVLTLCQDLPRSAFVPEAYRSYAYSDYRIPLGHGQHMMTPLEEATILQWLALKGDEHVLEVGTGSGYLTALLSQTAQTVTSIEYQPALYTAAKTRLSERGINNVNVLQGDAHRGWMDTAPYDVIVITGGLPKLDDIFKPQLMKGGKLFAILGSGLGMQGCFFNLDAKTEQWQSFFAFDTQTEALVRPNDPEAFQF